MRTLCKYSLAFFFVNILLVNAQEIKTEYRQNIQKTVAISYVLDYPQQTKTAVPLIVFLHGAGERGNNLELAKSHSPFTYKNLIKEPVALLAPQCPANQWWDTEGVYYLIKNIQAKYKIDSSRIYLTGLSMGGWGSWKLALEHPEMFAALATVCGAVDRPMKMQAEKYKDLPIKIFHGGNDDIVSPMYSIEMYQALRKYNSNVELVIFPDDNHNSWDSTYSSPAFYEWLLAQKKSSNNLTH